jgi:tight adherence protein B
MTQEFGNVLGQVSTSPLFKNLDQFVPDAARENQADKPSKPARRRRWVNWKTALEQADTKLSVRQLSQLAALVGLAIGAPGIWLGGPILGVAGALGGAGLPFFVVLWRGRARRDKLLNQLPSAFELMARIIRAGQSVQQALQAVADAFQDPIAGEFAKCQKQLTLGLAPEVAFREMAERSGILEMRIFVMSLLIQRQSGGSLSDVLERLAGLIRARLRLRRHIRSLTAEGRLQGWTLVVLPFVVFAAMMVVNRAYAEVLLQHSGLLTSIAASMTVGMLWIHKIVNAEY